MSINIGLATVPMGSKKISEEELKKVISKHALWLQDHDTGKRAELNGYRIEDVDISGVDLSQADLSGSSFTEVKLIGTNLSGARLIGTVFMNVDMTDAILDDVNLQEGDISHSTLVRMKAHRANFISCIMWDNDFTEAVLSASRFLGAQLCDGKFQGADLSYCDLSFADIDYANFEDAVLKEVDLKWTRNSYWASFKNADMEDIDLKGSAIDDKAVEGAKNLFVPMVCPEEGSFIAWKKCRDGKVIRLMVPEDAQRTGGSSYTCRASEVVILNIFDGENECEEAICLYDDEIVYHKGERIKDEEEFDPSLLHDGTGIHFYITRAEAERADYSFDEDDEEEEDGD